MLNELIYIALIIFALSMRSKERYAFCIGYFQEVLPMPETELHYTNPFELLIAVIISAQCTDKRVNMITPSLFQAYPDAHSMAKASQEEVFALIKSVSYPNNKAKHLLGAAQLLVQSYGGQVPSSWDALVTLPGVGRKTANVVANVIFGQNTMPVDTHVFRVSQRIGLVKPSKTPLAVETQLVANTPKDMLGEMHHWLILHGRYVCLARTPKCPQCGLKPVCKFYHFLQKKALKETLKLAKTVIPTP